MGLRLKEIACVQSIVAQKLERLAMQTVGAGLRHTVHDARIGPHGGQNKSLHHFELVDGRD